MRSVWVMTFPVLGCFRREASGHDWLVKAETVTRADRAKARTIDAEVPVIMQP
jgi:hypothetical protein